jgi:hypothetical protein
MVVIMQLTKDNYYSPEADRVYMSVSQFKSFRKCEAKAKAKLDGTWQEPKNEAFLIGSYVHAWSEGTLAEFKKEHPELYKKSDGALMQKFDIAEKMIAALKDDEFVTMVREGQKEVIMTAELFGVAFKCMIDIYNLDSEVIVDLKTTREIHKKYWNDDKRKFENFIECYDYLLQMAVYAEIDRINRGSNKYFLPHIVAVSKEDVPDKAVIFLGTDYIADKLLELELGIGRVVRVKQGLEEPIRCEKCDYCKATKKITGVVHYTDL